MAWLHVPRGWKPHFSRVSGGRQASMPAWVRKKGGLTVRLVGEGRGLSNCGKAPRNRWVIQSTLLNHPQESVGEVGVQDASSLGEEHL